MPPAWTDPCNGHFSHELIRGRCPIEIAAANRVVTGGRRSAAVGGILPSSLQDAISTSELAYLNTVDHTTDVGFDFDGSTIQELYDAAKAGVINAGDAMGELGGRIPSSNAADQTTIGHTISALENLVKVGHIVKNPSSITGNYLRVWSITTKKMKRLSGRRHRQQAASHQLPGRGQELQTRLTRRKSHHWTRLMRIDEVSNACS